MYLLDWVYGWRANRTLKHTLSGGGRLDGAGAITSTVGMVVLVWAWYALPIKDGLIRGAGRVNAGVAVKCPVR